MGIVRAIPLKDATATALTSCGVGTAFDLGAVTASESLYAGLHLLSSSTGDITFRIQGSSSSGCWKVYKPRCGPRAEQSRRSVGDTCNDGNNYFDKPNVLACGVVTNDKR